MRDVIPSVGDVIPSVGDVIPSVGDVIPSVSEGSGGWAARELKFMHCAPPAPPDPSLTLGMTRSLSR